MATDNELPDFSGKVVLFYLAGAARPEGVPVEYAEFRMHGNRLFVVGRVPELHGSDWAAGVQMAVAWESVESYVVFPSREDFAARMPRPTLRQRFFR